MKIIRDPKNPQKTRQDYEIVHQLLCVLDPETLAQSEDDDDDDGDGMDVSTAILRTSMVFERFRIGNKDGFGWDEDIAITDSFTAAQCLALRNALVRLIRKQDQPVGSITCDAVWALGKLQDKNVVPFLKGVLANQMWLADAALAQSLFALDSTGEKALHSYKKNKSSYGTGDPENMLIADAYLRKHGKAKWFSPSVPPDIAPEITTKKAKS